MNIDQKKITPMEMVLRAWNRLSPQEFYHWIYENGDVLLDLEKDQ